MQAEIRTERFDQLQDRWSSILEFCSTNTIFVTPWWQRIWWEHFGEKSDLQLLSVYSMGDLVGIAPLRLRGGTISFVGSKDLCDYGDFLVIKGKELIFFESLMNYLKALQWEVMELNSVPQNSQTLNYFPLIAKRLGYDVCVLKEDSVPFIDLTSLCGDYLMGLSKKHRHELRRKIRRLEDTGTFRQYTERRLENIRDSMGDFFRLHRCSSLEKSQFMTPENESFFMEVASDFATRGQFNLSFLEFDSVRVASCIVFDYGSNYLLYNSGYDLKYSNLSVGLLNKIFTVREAISAGRQRFDFLRGSERYKYELGAVDCSIFQIIVHR